MKSVSQLKRKLDRIFSKFIRLRDAHEWHKDNPDAAFGWVKCCTCGKVKHWKDVDAGHFVSRGRSPLRYVEWNVHSQCKPCNTAEGKKANYALFIKKKYGQKVLEEFAKKEHQTKKWNVLELEELIEYYSKKVKELENG